MLGLQPAQPGQLPRTGELGPGRLGQGLEIGGVPVMRLHPVATAREAFQRIVPDGLQQRKPRLAAAGFRTDQAAVHQRAQRFHHLSRPAGLALIGDADGFGREQAERPGEHSQPGEQRLLAGRQQAEAPVQGVLQGALPFGQVAGPAGQHAEPLVQPRGQRLRGQQPDPGRGQLDGQRQPVQPAADLRHRPGVFVGQLEARGNGVRPLHEQAHRGVPLQVRRVAADPGGRNRQRGHRELMLPGQAQHRPAGDQHYQAGSSGQQLSQQRSGAHNLLEIVQRQQQPPGPQVRLQVGDQRASGSVQAQPRGDRGRHQVGR